MERARRAVPPEVERAASGRPVLQIAVDGWWERAAIVPLPLDGALRSADRGVVVAAGDDPRRCDHGAAVAGRDPRRDDHGVIVAAADGPLGERAVEVLWPGPPVVFVGARFRDERPPLAELGARAEWTPATALELLAGDTPGAAVRAELGAVNAWRSVGPLPVRLDATAEELARDLEARPELARCPHPVALEVVHEEPRETWWAIEVSARAGAVHEVSAERVARVLAAQRASARPWR